VEEEVGGGNETIEVRKPRWNEGSYSSPSTKHNNICELKRGGLAKGDIGMVHIDGQETLNKTSLDELESSRYGRKEEAQCGTLAFGAVAKYNSQERRGFLSENIPKTEGTSWLQGVTIQASRKLRELELWRVRFRGGGLNGGCLEREEGMKATLYRR